jgi:hypothetical protein
MPRRGNAVDTPLPVAPGRPVGHLEGQRDTVEQHNPAFRQLRTESGRALPGHVQEEFEAYLWCGRLEEGFLRVRCEQCHAESSWRSAASGAASAPRAAPVRAAMQGRGLGSADPGRGSLPVKGFSGRLRVRWGMLVSGLTGRRRSASGPG